MLVSGIDIGSRAAKCIVMKDDIVLSSAICDTGPESVKTANSTLGKALEGTGFKPSDLNFVVATGYGRILVPFAQENVSEISAHARGINYYFPNVRTILDMGGQDCKAINIDGEGKVTNFVMNDKCAGGTGRFLEMISEVLGVPLSDIGKVALESRNSIPFNTICAVFARSEALAYMRRGVEKGDILSGLNEAISVRCLSLLKRVSIQNDFAITGGIAKNKGMVAKLTEKVGLQPQLAEDPQLIGALGAALFALDKLRGKNIKERFKVNYGYSDGSGSYFIAVDPALCDGCGKCISACPASLYEVTGTDGLKNAAVKPAVRRKISTLCPGAKQCRGQEGGNCKQVCPQQAIELSW